MRSYGPGDFKVEWFSGTGPGGQHRNKHQNCCRIRHLETGLVAQCTRNRSRVANQREAFRRLAGMLLAKEDAPAERRSSVEVVRTVHAVRGEVIDHGSGLRKCPDNVLDGDLDDFLTHRGAHERPSTGRT